MRASDIILAASATLRLTRFITSDFLGEWVMVRPLKRWAHDRETPRPMYFWKDGEEFTVPDVVGEWRAIRDETNPDPANGWRSKLVKGLDCPFCVGFWVGLAALTAIILCPRPLKAPLRLLYGALGLNYAVGHLSSRID